MSNWPTYPAIYEINTWVWLNELSREVTGRVTLGNIPQDELERLKDLHFDALWLMGIWEHSPAGRGIAQEHPGLKSEYRRVLPDYASADVIGSPYAVHEYRVDPALGGDEELAILRRRLADLGIRLILDFVSNHLATDHPWVTDHPERLVQGSQSSLLANPDNYFKTDPGSDGLVFAHGRPAGTVSWTDTVQLDYRQPATRRAMTDVLMAISERCDGLRCDMAMLVTHDVFLRAWGGEFQPRRTEFWPDAISKIKAVHPDFLMLAEVYWDLEFDLQEQGFDYTYDKRLYDRLVSGDAPSVKSHLRASLEYQRRLTRFTENHDEERALEVFGLQRSKAAATLSLTVPGLRLFHEGQIEGRRLRQPLQLKRRPREPVEPDLQLFYQRLLRALSHPTFHTGEWRLLEPQEAWSGNSSYHNFVGYSWALGEERRVVVINLSSQPAQCYLPLEMSALAGSSWHLNDLLSEAKYQRDGDALIEPGLYLDLPGHGCHLFQLSLRSKKVPYGFRHRCTFQQQKSGIYGLAWSPDGRILALSGEDKLIWLVNTGDCGSVRQLHGHDDVVCAVAWSPDGRMLASGSNDHTIRLWEIHGALTRTLVGHLDNVLTVAWSPDSRMLASGSTDRKTIVWDIERARLLEKFGEHTDAVNCVAWSPDGKTLASGSGDRTIYLRDLAGRKQRVLEGRNWVGSIAWSPNGRILASATGGGTIDLWNVDTALQVAVREGHTERLLCVAFSPDGRLLVSKSADNSVRFWRCDNWEEIATLEEYGEYLSGVSFHPTKPILASRDDKANVVRIWDLNEDALLGSAPATRSVHYTNAKVVFVGESGTGKSCLARALTGSPFEPQPSTHGMTVLTLSSESTKRPGGGEVTREILLWDLAGQSDYRIVHQLFLDETALAIVLCEPTHPESPFSGVGYWESALRRVAGESCPRVLVAGRIDRGHPTVSRADIEAFCREHSFTRFIATSAVTGEGVDELRATIRQLIPWERLPVTTSPEVWKHIRQYLVDRRAGPRVLIPLSDLSEAFRTKHPHIAVTDAEFSTVIRQAQAEGLLRQLSFGDLVLLKPEVLRDYASAVIRVARKHPMGLGTISKRAVLEAKIDFEDMTRLSDAETERSLLHAVVELFLDREVALPAKPSGKDEQLVFPSQFNRKRPESSTLPRREVSYRFVGSVEAIYATLVVRLFYSGGFELKQLWKDAAEFRNSGGEICGFVLEDIKEGHGTISIFFEESASVDSRLVFEKFIHEHLLKQALVGSVVRERIYRCSACGENVENKRAIQIRLRRGLPAIPCQFCGNSILLIDPAEESFGGQQLLEQVRALEANAEGKKDEEVGVTRADAKTTVGQFDVFLAHNNSDKPQVRDIAAELKRRSLNPWLDEWEIRPGQWWQEVINQTIHKVKSAAIFIGPGGLGKWESLELRAFISECVEDSLTVIPVLLPGVEKIPENLPFLSQLQIVRFATGTNDAKALDDLEWGITGEHPQRRPR